MDICITSELRLQISNSSTTVQYCGNNASKLHDPTTAKTINTSDCSWDIGTLLRQVKSELWILAIPESTRTYHSTILTSAGREQLLAFSALSKVLLSITVQYYLYHYTNQLHLVH